MTFDLGIWPFTAWTYEGSHIIPIIRVWFKYSSFCIFCVLYSCTGAYLWAVDMQWLQVFYKRCGPLIHDAEATPTEIFSDLLSNAFIEYMVCKTKRYADHFVFQDMVQPCQQAQDFTGGEGEKMWCQRKCRHFSVSVCAWGWQNWQHANVLVQWCHSEPWN